MFLRELRQPVTVLPGAGPAVSGRLARLGIWSVADLLLAFPRDYEDRTEPVPLAQWARGRVDTVATVLAHDSFHARSRGGRILKITVEDGSAEAELVCVNRPFLARLLPVGSRIALSGPFEKRFNRITSIGFQAEPLGEGQEPVRGIFPVYDLTEGLPQGTMRKLKRHALSGYGSRVEDELPASLIAARGLLPKREALAGLHFPPSLVAAQAARETLAFEELFYLELAVARRARRRRDESRVRTPVAGRLRRRLIERLPFALTPDQEGAVADIAADLGAPHPMARLLQGDVGSGKTLVAFLAALDAIEAGGQAAIMAPTEILARQHAGTAARLLEPLGVRLAFLSGNLADAARPPLLAAIEAGEVDLVLGTQALFSDDVRYRNLSLAVVDEQQRFGVLQRIALQRKGPLPDLLLMSATPIPRTLALTVFGDLAVSTIRTMPPGRKPVITHLTRQGNEAKVYEFVRRELEAGRQAFFVYPLLDSSERLELKNAIAMAERLATGVYPGLKVGLVHSKVKEEEKRATMEAFSGGTLDLLVATSVVEVGVDVPNASCMVVEHAERFGLAALHQLRGRVGRGAAQSYCFLVYSDKLTEDGKARLKAMLETQDGFELAERDLRIRGPGEIAGTAQSGFLKLTVADPVRDALLLEEARKEAFALVDADPGFLEADHAVIRAVLERANPFSESAPVSG